MGEKEWHEEPGDLTTILNFYFQSQSPDAQPLYEAKLLIVGEGGAGKTSLAQKLLDNAYELKPTEKSTEGIAVLRWEFSQENGQPFRARIWDFGGQEIYHQTHQFFLSKRSLYVLVADTRKEDTDFYYWLKTIELLGDDSPVIIVKNEKDDRQREINDRQLRGEFTHLEKILAVNLATNRGLPELQQYLSRRLSQLDHVATPIPPYYLRIRAIIENCTRTRNILDRQEYFGFCRQNGITDQTEMLAISDYLHDLGICLHFQKDPLLKHYLILKPEWGTAAAYKILDNKAIRHAWGHFSKADLAELWTDEYEEFQDELLQLMKNFKLCYEIPRSPDEYIAPQLLSEKEPCYKWDDSQNLHLHYKYDFMPKGILSRLIVELHEYIQYQPSPSCPDEREDGQPEEALVWKTGVILTNGSATAEVLERYHQKTIEIRVNGSRQRDWLLPIAHELDKIHAGYDRLQVQKMIPCNCDRCRFSSDPEFYDLKTLQRYENDRRPDIDCRKSYDRVNVRRLIDDVVDELRYPDPKHRNDRYYGLGLENDRFSEPTLPPPSHNAQGVTVIVQQNQEQKTMSNQFNIEGNYNHRGDNVGRDKINTQINNASPNLVEAAQQIKALLEELSEEYNPNTTKGQNLITQEAIQRLKNDRTLQQRFLNALKEGGTTAIEELIDHPVVKPLVAAFKGFTDA